MIAVAVAWSARHHRLVIAVALLAVTAGELARRALSRDALPDLSDPQIALVSEWTGYPATEVATVVTSVLTAALIGVPGSTAVRGASMSGMAYVNVVFGSASDLEKSRELILQRVAAVRTKLPSAARVQVGPAAASSGWVFEYALVDPTHGESQRTLRRFQEDVLRPALAATEGVAEVASVGGEVEQVLVDVNSDLLRKQGLAFSDLISPLERALATNARTSLADLHALPIPGPGSNGEHHRLGDVAILRVTGDMPSGLADLDGRAAVGGIVIARPDADLSTLLPSLQRKLDRLRLQLRPGVKLLTTYDRSSLIGRIQKTLLRVLGEEVAVVALVILIFLLHARSALVPLATLPAVLLLTFAGMWILGVPATIMSLGGIAIALGMAVDADLVALEACHRGLEASAASPSAEQVRARLIAASVSFAPAILISLLIAALSFLPVLAFAGETGRLLRPLAITKTLVIGSAALVSLSLAPALRDRLLRGRVIPEFDNPVTRSLVRIYRPFVHFALSRPILTLLIATLLLVSCVPIALRLGGEFLPRIEEGDLLFMPTTLPGAPMDEVGAQVRLQDRALAKSTEVASVFGKVGRADTATDPAPFSMAETTIRLRPRAEWSMLPRQRWYSKWAPPFLRRALRLVWPEETPMKTSELIEKLDLAARLPGWASAWTAPARARMDMMATGIRTPIGIRISAADSARLAALGTALRSVAIGLPGTRSAAFEPSGDETWLEFVPDPEALATHHVDPVVVSATAGVLIRDGEIGQLETQGRRLRVRLAQDFNLRGPADQLREVSVRSTEAGGGQAVPLSLVGRPSYRSRPAVVRTEGPELAAYIHIDVTEGTDLLGYVERAKREIQKEFDSGALRLRTGERIEWVGQYPLIVAGAKRLRWIVPIVALSMLALLYLQFRNLTEALIILTSVPFALVGSFWTLFWLGYPYSAPVWVGLLSVAGLAMQTGVVMVVYVDEAFYRRLAQGRLRSREDIVAAHAEGTVRRLRPKIMTITTMAATLLPLLWAEGSGAEIMKRVAAPMIGGLATSAFLTLEVLPVLYTVWRNRQLEQARRLDVPIENIVGVVPPWARHPTLDLVR